MSCQTCSHTMSVLCDHNGVRYSHCPRCGTLLVEPLTPSGMVAVYVPSLVRRCLDFEVILDPKDVRYRLAWHRLGIPEATCPPENRMKP